MSLLSVLDEKPENLFTPSLLVVNATRTPHPILPVNYSFFVHVELPRFTIALPLPSQLLVANRATDRRRAYPFPGPFAGIQAFAFHRSNRMTIYLTESGEFPS
jgi:hypothetical protein